jgi:hypothetical protein
MHSKPKINRSIKIHGKCEYLSTSPGAMSGMSDGRSASTSKRKDSLKIEKDDFEEPSSTFFAAKQKDVYPE